MIVRRRPFLLKATQSSSGPAAWAPSDVSGLYLWFKKGDVNLTGSDVNSWNESVGGWTANSTSTTKPTYVAGTGEVNMPGALSILNTGTGPGICTQPIYIFALVKQHIWNSLRRWWQSADGASCYVRDQTAEPQVEMRGSSKVGSNVSPAMNTWYACMAKYTNTANAAVLQFGSDGAIKTTGASGTSVFRGIVWGGDTAASACKGVSFIEMFMYQNVTLSSADETAALEYLESLAP